MYASSIIYIHKFSLKKVQQSNFKFQKIFKVHINLTSNEKISKIFLSSLQFIKTRKNFKVSKCKCLVVKCQKILKIFKVQTGSEYSRWLVWKKNFKVESQIWLNKFQKSKNKSKFRLAEIFSNFPWKYNWTNYRSQLDICTTKIWEENLNSNQIQCANVQMFKLKLKYNQVLWASTWKNFNSRWLK